MNALKTVALAVGVPLTILAGAGRSAAAPLPSTSDVAEPAFSPSGVVPDDWRWLVDDTGTITIAIPTSWVDVDTAPDDNVDGPPAPWISATTDIARVLSPDLTRFTYSVPGVFYTAEPYREVTTASIDAFLFGQCTAEPAQAYDDGVFVGYIQYFAACGGTTSRAVEVVANPKNGAFTARLLVQLVGAPDDDATLDGLLSSFNSASESTAPTTTIVGDGDPLAEVRQLARDQFGVELTDEQARCMRDATDGMDPDVVEIAFYVVAVECDVALDHLLVEADEGSTVTESGGQPPAE